MTAGIATSRLATIGDRLTIDVDQPTRSRARELSAEVMGRLADRAIVSAATASHAQQTSHQPPAAWRAEALAYGDAGLALAFAEMDVAEPGRWALAAHQSLEKAGRALSGDPSLHDGLAGVYAATWYASRGRTRYAKALFALETAHRTNLERLAITAHGSPERCELFTGLTGLVAMSSMDSYDPVVPRIALAALAEALGDDASLRARFPDGYVDNGMAHGIAGPLAQLALLRLAGGADVTGLDPAIQWAGSWLARHLHEVEGGVWWPATVSLHDGVATGTPPAVAGLHHGEVAKTPPEASAGWCNGVAGLARALWLAGWAIGDRRQMELALSATRALCSRATSPGSTGLCHGLAGVALVAMLFAHETGDAQIRDGASRMIRYLIDRYEPDSLLGFRDREVLGNPVDDAGFLNGAAGVALVLSIVASQRLPPWLRLMLLA